MRGIIRYEVLIRHPRSFRNLVMVDEKKFPVFGMTFLLFLLSGCSVMMAASGTEEPDLYYVQDGNTREVVEGQLGQPIKSIPLANGEQEEHYEYYIGNKPSAGKAWGYFLTDVLTLGTAEIFTTPVEMASGQKFKIIVVYDAMDKVIKVGQPIQIDPDGSTTSVPFDSNCAGC